MTFDYREAKNAYWARYMIQKSLFMNEKYFL